MDQQMENADFVLVVSTETYQRRATGRERPGVGRGLRFESVLIIQDLYDAGMRNEDIVKPLRPFTYYRLGTEEGYEALYRRLTGQPPFWKPDLGEQKALLPRVSSVDSEETNHTTGRVHARLTIRAGGSTGAVLYEANTALVRIGRDPTSDIVVPNPASWEHGRILLTSAVYLYQHLGRSPTLLRRRNGLSIELSRNGKSEEALRQFDKLVIAGSSMTVQFDLPRDSDYATTGDDFL
jgi:hypothetical protein